MNKQYTFQYYALRDDKIVYKGNKWDFMELFKVSEDYIDDAIEFNTKVREYTIKREIVNRDDVIRLDIKKENEKTKKNKTLDYLITHLERFGNTCLGSMPEYKVQNYIDELAKVGIKATYRKVKCPDDPKPWYLIKKSKYE